MLLKYKIIIYFSKSASAFTQKIQFFVKCFGNYFSSVSLTNFADCWGKLPKFWDHKIEKENEKT